MDKEEILEILQVVKDPEIPNLSIVDLGVITGIEIENKNLKIILTPTFSGCPALKVMEEDIKSAIKDLPFENKEVSVSYDTQWSSNLISERGRKILKESGFAPPPHINGLVQIDIFKKVKCPFCESDNTNMQTPFGPTLCRAIHYCNNCKQAFEQFKPV
ncbi:MAG TPA: phenylacetate-CoA oxygenase subunit PaaJ [Ignavibacteria bacterium]|nr:phenylacetate-CoA oxygenase subunit PaaJ [Ignavibacteria bacterium]